MIPMASGVRVWLASGHSDMRRGMRGLALQVQEGLGRDPHAGTFTSSAAAADRLSKRSGMTALVCRFMRSDWTVESLFGRRPWPALWHFLPDRWVIFLKGLIGAIHSKAGVRKRRDSWKCVVWS